MPQKAIDIIHPVACLDGVDAVVQAIGLLSDMAQDVTSTVVMATALVGHSAVLCVLRDVRMVFALCLMYVAVILVGTVLAVIQPSAIQLVRMVEHVPLPMSAPVTQLFGRAAHVNNPFVHLGVRMVVPAHHLVCVSVQLDGMTTGALQI
jgi:hypothetical protein